MIETVYTKIWWIVCYSDRKLFYVGIYWNGIHFNNKHKIWTFIGTVESLFLWMVTFIYLVSVDDIIFLLLICCKFLMAVTCCPTKKNKTNIVDLTNQLKNWIKNISMVNWATFFLHLHLSGFPLGFNDSNWWIWGQWINFISSEYH